MLSQKYIIELKPSLYSCELINTLNN